MHKLSALYELSASFRASQARRLTIRWLVMQSAVLATVFWTVALLAAAWLIHLGMGWIVWVVGAVWLYLSLPGLILQTLFIADLFLYALTGRVLVFPTILAGYHERKARRKEPVPPVGSIKAVRARLYRFAAGVSPLAGLSTWASVVLVRLPAAAHVTRQELEWSEAHPERTARSEVRRAIYVGRELEGDMFDLVARQPFAGVSP